MAQIPAPNSSPSQRRSPPPPVARTAPPPSSPSAPTPAPAPLRRTESIASAAIMEAMMRQVPQERKIPIRTAHPALHRPYRIPQARPAPTPPQTLGQKHARENKDWQETSLRGTGYMINELLNGHIQPLASKEEYDLQIAEITRHQNVEMDADWGTSLIGNIGSTGASTCIITLVKGTLSDNSPFYAVHHQSNIDTSDIFQLLHLAPIKPGTTIRNATVNIIAFSNASKSGIDEQLHHIQNHQRQLTQHKSVIIFPNITDLEDNDELMKSIFTDHLKRPVFSDDGNSNVAAGFNAHGEPIALVKCSPIGRAPIRYFKVHL